MKTAKILLLLWVLLLALFAACSDDDASISVDEETVDSSSSSSTTLAELELYYNYLLLSYYYYWASDELGEYEDYDDGDVSYSDVYSMYGTLSDAYTYYYDPTYAYYVYSLITETESEVGLGIEIDDDLYVKYVYADGPAEEAGVKRGDLVLTVDSVVITTVNAFEKMTAGSAGDTISLSVLRNDSVLDFSIVIAEVTLPTVYVDSVSNVPLIRVTEFASETYDEWVAALEETDGASGVIVDLRQNTGGLISVCLSMAATALSKNDTIVIFKEATAGDSGQVIETYAEVATEDGIASDRYFVFLADDYTASCSEQMLAALTANKKSPIIGELTYGKGIGQAIGFTYADGLASITYLRAFDKDGGDWHTLGFEPDYESDDEDEIYAKAVEFVEVEQEREAGFGTSSAAAKGLGIEESIELRFGAWKLLDSLDFPEK